MKSFFIEHMHQFGLTLTRGLLSLFYYTDELINLIKINHTRKFKEAILELLYNYSNLLFHFFKLFLLKFYESTDQS